MVVGNMNILISAPHDGPLKPDDIHDREKDSNGNYKNDTNTRKIAHVLSEELTRLFSAERKTPLSPFVVYNNLHRYLRFRIVYSTRQAPSILPW